MVVLLQSAHPGSDEFVHPTIEMRSIARRSGY
ncbi:hypothetical protein SCNU_07508 [Gordonia neofelifaecis NRRL B-59395]|uniref:Uncharacterized protein n=1 Tax=Gordonia neofelifaecis NRRL B-59395 TaxID=644548 RepID=F1YHY7_9ACTN|nr:hypothetical protein SCNU_07508 [Gordonia neofelifaecis NRRL B-59395]